ncbi:MAG TPA: GNAT family N-acetyltransferase [Actinomycetota bacterium]|nr:GNAT family N-acetyltransferase [Actinomycetota bacterium]
MSDRLLRLLRDAAAGNPPPADGVVEVWPGPAGPVDAVLAFTAHHVVAAGVDPDEVAGRLPPGDLGAPTSPDFLAWLGGRLGSHPGSLDVVLAAGGLGGAPPLELKPVADPGRHPRAARASRYRRDLRVWTDPDGAGLLVLGRGLAGRREVAFEVDPSRRNRGLGRLLVAAARHLTPPDEPLFAQVAPGNAASLRVVEAAGFRPLGAEVLFHRDGAAS